MYVARSDSAELAVIAGCVEGLLIMMDPSRVQELPPSCFYVPCFITAPEEQRIINEIHKLPQSRWINLTHRRLLSIPSTLTGAAHDTLLAAPLPNFLLTTVALLREAKFFEDSPHKEPNHVLINEYKPGEGIMPHEDGPSYSPITATVSLGSHTVLEIYKKNRHGEREAKATWRILQEPRSLLVTTGDMYVDTFHGISELHADEALSAQEIVNWELLGDIQPYETGQAQRSTRISLTLRDVSRVARLGGALKFMSNKTP